MEQLMASRANSLTPRPQSSRPEPTRDPDRLLDGLCDALLAPSDRESMRRLLVDLCTPAETRTLAERWHVARLLDATPLSYRDIHDATGVSTTTIVRIARFLRGEANQGYRLALDAIGGRDAG